MAKSKLPADEPTTAGEEIAPDTVLDEGALAQPLSEEGDEVLEGSIESEPLVEAAEEVVAAGKSSELAEAAEEVLESLEDDDQSPAVEAQAAADAAEEEIIPEAELAESDEETAVVGADGFGTRGDWFVIHTYSGYENKVKTNLEHRIQSMDVSDKIFHVVIPTEEEIEIREGQRKTVAKKIFPGYVLVQMNMDDESWYVVRNTPGVTGFVAPGGGSTSKPTPLGATEVQNILRRMKVAAPKVKVGFSIGESVRIIEGPFQDFVGSVDEINVEKGKVKVLVSFFGRETPVELDFLQVERM